MDIAGVLVHAKPSAVDLVAECLGRLPGVEIHARTRDSRFVVTIEDDGHGGVSDTLSQVNTIQGVLSAAMVYQHAEDEQ